MYRIIDGRGTGKTGRLMLLAKENNAIIVCKNPTHMRQKAHAYGITGLNIISYSDLLAEDRTGARENVYIDELECFINYMLQEKGVLAGYTLSEE